MLKIGVLAAIFKNHRHFSTELKLLPASDNLSYSHPKLLRHWQDALHSYGDWTPIFVVSALLFPKPALGLSAFEMGVSVMPLVDGGPESTMRYALASFRKGASATRASFWFKKRWV